MNLFLDQTEDQSGVLEPTGDQVGWEATAVDFDADACASACD